MQSEAYFDIKGYFEKEAIRLNKLDLSTEKSVAIDGEKEQKLVKISDFNQELSAFIAADINKASWRGAFVVTKQNEIVRYTTENKKIPVSAVKIAYRNNKLKSIQLVVKTDNILYQSIDTLSYFPDSLYEIKKTQKIKLLKEKKYVVVGKFKQAALL